MKASHLLRGILVSAWSMTGFGIALAQDSTDSAQSGAGDMPMAHHGGADSRSKATGGMQMQGGGGHMMRGDSPGGMMAHHQAMMGSGAPTVVINIYPGGGVSMQQMPMAGRHGGSGPMGGMMGQMGHGRMMSHGGMMEESAQHDPVTVDSVRERLTARLGAMPQHGHHVGEITALDDDLINAEIVDDDGAVVRRIIFNRHTGESMRVR